MIGEMVESIQNPDESAERKKQALNNLVIYSHQSGGRDILLKGGYLQKLIPILCADAEKCCFFMKMCHGFCENNFNLTLTVLRIVTTEKLNELTKKFANNLEFIKGSLSFIMECLKSMTSHFKNIHQLKPEHIENNFYIRESLQNVKDSLERIPQYTALLQLLVALLMDKNVTAEVRDLVIDAFTQAVAFHKAISDFIIKNRGIVKLLEMAASSIFPMLKKEIPIAVNEDTYYHVSVTLASIYDNLDYDEKARQKFEDQAEGIIKILLTSENDFSKLQGLVAISALIMANREAGNIICNKNDTIHHVLLITGSGEWIAEKLGGEVLALAATDKDICKTLADQGLSVMKKLYQSKDNEIRVRGLVSLCKVCMKGSGSIKDQILADNGNVKLFKSCRKFLLSDKKMGLKKWAAEALAYLTLDADVKEMLVEDSDVLNGLLELAKGNKDSTVTYSVVGIYVNLTNSYDKPEKNPELEEVAKFAQHNLPQPHEKDSEEYATKRLEILVKNGLISALVNFSAEKSRYSKEMMARVFGAIVENVSYRGKVVAEGGVKTLLYLTEKGTMKGMDTASQSLAKIAITSDPQLAFANQRCMEVVRPLVKLLHFKKEALHRFESLMALTNLASMNDDVRRRIMKEKGFFAIETLMFEDDDDLRRAATECMCNLVQNEQAFNMFKEESDAERLKLVTMYCGEDPPELARAASGTLALLTSSEEICRKILEYKSTMDVLKFLVLNEDLAIRFRGLYIVANMIQSEKDTAEIIVKDQLFDVLMAYNLSSAGDANCTKENERSIAALKKWDLIENNPSK